MVYNKPQAAAQTAETIAPSLAAINLLRVIERECIQHLAFA